MITPHEDQELHRVGSFGECSLALVTLMGIGNPTEAVRVAKEQAELITPHGDREPTADASGIAKTDAHSLPLMGIGNRGRHRPQARRVDDLITPHGDREQ